MTILDILESEIPKESRSQIDNVHRLECEEVLDNLGYVNLNRNDNNLKLDQEDFKRAIKEFRQEYSSCYKAFSDYDEFSRLKNATLTEAEIEFMQTLSSLENEFDLHNYSLDEIESNMLLSRVLTFRLCILSVFDVKISNELPENVDTFFNQLKVWCNTNDTNEIIRFLGDIDDFSEVISVSNDNSDTLSHYFAFFEAQEQRFKMPELPIGTNWEFFKEKFSPIDKKYTDVLAELKRKKKKNETYIDNPLNQIQLRIIQIRLWLLGTYEEALDNDIGPVTVEGIKNALDHAIDSSNSKADDYLLRNLIFYIGEDTWVVNVNFLFKQVFPIFLDNQNTTDNAPETLSEKIMQIIDQLDKEKDKKVIFSDIYNRVNKSSNEVVRRKVKTRGGKGFLNSLRKFFSQLFKLIKDGVYQVKKFLNKLFSRIKNCVRILVREFKKIINMIKTALTFFFSKRIVNTGDIDKGISTDFDLNFDNYTKINNINSKLVDDHIHKLNYIAKSMEETSDFLGVIVSIILKVVKGPYGWVQIALEVIKYLADTKFSYNKLLFRSFV